MRDIVACDTMEWHKGRCEENLNSFSRHLVLHLAFPGVVVDACTWSNIQEVEEEEEEEEDTPHVDTWRNTKEWVDFLDGLH